MDRVLLRGGLQRFEQTQGPHVPEVRGSDQISDQTDINAHHSYPNNEPVKAPDNTPDAQADNDQPDKVP